MRKKFQRNLKAVLILTMLLCMLLPVGVAFAESFGRTSTVVVDAGDVIGDTYQRHTFIAEGLHWVFYATDDAIYYTSSADATTWLPPQKFDDYICDMPALACCNATAFALWYDLAANYVDIAWMNITGENEPIYYRMGHPVSNGTITWYPAFEAVPAVTDLTYSHPSICDNTADYPFIAYMVYNSSSSGYSGSVSADCENDGTWVSATNSTINSEVSLNISLDVLYPSVVPVSAGNISVMVVFDTGVNYQLAQNYLKYNVGTDEWTYPAAATFPLPATSYIDVNDLPYHSEVGWAGNLSNVDDVYALATANDSIIGKYLWSDHYGATITPWSGANVVIDTGYFRGSLAIRNALGYLTASVIDQVQKVDMYQADYDMTSQSWSALATIAGIDATSGTHTESDYDNAGTDYQGVIYYDNMAAFVPDLEYGCYGCPPSNTPSSVPASVTMMAWIVILVFGALICLILLAYGASESIKGRGGIEFIKIGVAGLIGLIIAAIIVAATL